MCVPVAGHISAAIYRSRFGLLPACAAGPGGRVGAPAGPLQPRGASPGCCTSAIQASAQGRDLTYPRQDRSLPPSVALRVGPGSKEPSGPEGLCIGFIVN